MNHTEIAFERKKLAATCIVDKELDRRQNYRELQENSLRVALTGHVYAASLPEQKKLFTFKPPTFLEWLLRKPRTVELKVKISDLLIDPPPASPPTLRIMTLENMGEGKD